MHWIGATRRAGKEREREREGEGQRGGGGGAVEFKNPIGPRRQSPLFSREGVGEVSRPFLRFPAPLPLPFTSSTSPGPHPPVLC